jgi:hypothetical protein
MNAPRRYRPGGGFSEAFERSVSSGTPALPTGDKMSNVTLPCNTTRCSRSWHGHDCLSVLARSKWSSTVWSTAIEQRRLSAIRTECAIK